MKKIFLIPLVLLLGIFQTALGNSLQIFGVKPDFLLAIMVLMSFFPSSLRASLPLSMLAGLFKDIFSVCPFGLHTLLFFIWSLLIWELSRKVSTEEIYMRVIFVMVATIANDAALRAFLGLSGVFLPLSVFLRISFLEAAYTSFSVWIILSLLKRKEQMR